MILFIPFHENVLMKMDQPRDRNPDKPEKKPTCKGTFEDGVSKMEELDAHLINISPRPKKDKTKLRKL